jgi:hypothetical protein
MSKSIVLPALPQQNKGMSLKYFVVFLVAMAVLFSLAHAGTDQTAVDDVWTELQGWAKGAPGKIIALLSFLNYTNAIGSIIFCLMMANASDIIENFLTMSF